MKDRRRGEKRVEYGRVQLYGAQQGEYAIAAGSRGSCSVSVTAGTSAFHGTYNRLSNELLNKLGIRIDVEEIFHSGKRILIFHVPSRPVGSVIRSTGHYGIPMRAGESICEMDDLTLKSILNENAPDLSMSNVPGLAINDLDGKALDIFKEKWALKSKRDDYRSFPDDKMLRSIGVLTDNGMNLTGLILFGKRESADTA